MSEYLDDIDTSAYIYKAPINITEVEGIDHTNYVIRLMLDSSNFNFGLAQTSGYDFRLADKSNGTGILKTWIASWSSTNKRAMLWFLLPLLPANTTKTLWAFWGNPTAINVSDMSSVNSGFLLSDDFYIFDTNKWTNNGTYTITAGGITMSQGAYIEAKNSPLEGVDNWILECGILGLSANNTDYYSTMIYFTASDVSKNPFRIYLYHDGGTDIKHDIVNGSTITAYNGSGYGIQTDSINNFYIYYYQPEDKITYGMKDRTILPDYEVSYERGVLGNTRPNTIRLYGNESNAFGIRYDWIVVRHYEGISAPIIDTSSLYVPYEDVEHQPLETYHYSDDLTSVDYYHSASAGGDPYTMSDNLSGVTNTYTSTNISGSIIIDFGRTKTNIVSSNYIHYDSGHVLYYNASKLSDLGLDESGRSYWNATTTSGWAAIDFTAATRKIVRAVSVYAEPSKLGGMIKNFRFLASNSNPVVYKDTAYTAVLYEGTFQQTTGEQTFYLTNDSFFRYYILEALNTYGQAVALKEWGMYEADSYAPKRKVDQLRLLPAAFDSNEDYFPKNIIFYGSNNYNSWQLLTSVATATPYYDYVWGRWQRYSFANVQSYYAYKLVFSGTWANMSTVKIADWELVQRIKAALLHIINFVDEGYVVPSVPSSLDIDIGVGFSFIAEPPASGVEPAPYNNIDFIAEGYSPPSSYDINFS